MKVCKSCQTEINEKAKKCPNCRADQRNFFAKHKILTALLILVLLGIIMGAAGGGSDKAADSTGGQNAQAVSQQAKTAEKITAAQLADDFDANQVAAEKTWKDKYVEFSATIGNITDSGLSFTDVASKEFSMTQISCRITDKDDLLGVANGQQVTVRGTVGGQTFGVIDLKDCSLVK